MICLDKQQLTENETGETEMRHWKEKKVENTANRNIQDKNQSQAL